MSIIWSEKEFQSCFKGHYYFFLIIFTTLLIFFNVTNVRNLNVVNDIIFKSFMSKFGLVQEKLGQSLGCL